MLYVGVVLMGRLPTASHKQSILAAIQLGTRTSIRGIWGSFRGGAQCVSIVSRTKRAVNGVHEYCWSHVQRSPGPRGMNRTERVTEPGSKMSASHVATGAR